MDLEENLPLKRNKIKTGKALIKNEKERRRERSLKR
jgi:hypothetical protein